MASVSVYVAASVSVELRKQAGLNVGRAATHHAAVQTEEPGIRRIINQIESFNKLLSANNSLQERIQQTSQNGLDQLEQKFRTKWDQLQEILQRRMDDVADQEHQASKVMQLIRRHHLEVTMGQLASHYHKVQQKRQADMEFFKLDLKAKFADELHRKAMEVEEYRLQYRVIEKQLEKRKAEIAAAEMATAKAKTDAMDLISKKLLESMSPDQQLIADTAVSKAMNLEIIKQTLAGAADQKVALETSLEHLRQETEKQEISIRLLDYNIDRTLHDIVSANDAFKTYRSQLRHTIHEVTAEMDKINEATEKSLAMLQEKANVIPTKVLLQQELDRVNQECDDLVETGRILRDRGRLRAAQWLKKLSVLENATKELRKEMFRKTYTQKISKKSAGMQAKNPVILKGPISKDIAEDYIENMGNKILLPKAKPGKVIAAPEKAKQRLADKHKQIRFVTGEESLEEILRKGEKGKDGKDLVALFSQESDIDKLVKELEHLEMNQESQRRSLTDDSDASDVVDETHRSSLVNPFLPSTELTESLIMLAAIEEEFENKRNNKRLSKRMSKKVTGFQTFRGLQDTPNQVIQRGNRKRNKKK